MIVMFPRIIAQLMGLLIMIGIIYVIFYVVVKLPKSMKENRNRMQELERKMDMIESTLNEINTK